MITRTYKASTQAKAAQKMQADGTPPGHVMGGQSWAPGGRSCAASGFVGLGVLLLIVGLVFPHLWAVALICLVIGLVSRGTDGELTVTWIPAPSTSSTPVPVAASAPVVQPTYDAAGALKALADMRDAGHITQEEYDAKKAELLAKM